MVNINNEKISLRDAGEEDLEAVLLIADTELGTGYFQGIYASQPFKSSSLLRVAVSESGQIKGFCYSYLTSPEEINTQFLSDQNTLTQLQGPIGIIKSLAVNADFKEQGVGKTLFEDSVERLKHQGAKACFCTCWKTHHNPGIMKIMDHLGFTRQKEIPNFWTIDSIEQGYACPVCGHPCNCSAFVYYKTF